MKRSLLLAIAILLGGWQVHLGKGRPRMLEGSVAAYPPFTPFVGDDGFIGGGYILLVTVKNKAAPAQILKLVSSGPRKTGPSSVVIDGLKPFRVLAERDLSCDETNVEVAPAKGFAAEKLNASPYVFNDASGREAVVTIPKLECYRIVRNPRW